MVTNGRVRNTMEWTGGCLWIYFHIKETVWAVFWEKSGTLPSRWGWRVFWSEKNMCQRLKCDKGSLELWAEWSGVGVWGSRKQWWKERNIGSGLEPRLECFTGVVERCLQLSLQNTGSIDKGVLSRFALANHAYGSRLWFFPLKIMEWWGKTHTFPSEDSFPLRCVHFLIWRLAYES